MTRHIVAFNQYILKEDILEHFCLLFMKVTFIYYRRKTKDNRKNREEN